MRATAKLALWAAIQLFLCTAGTQAAIVSWTNSNSGLWSTGTNWSSGAPPASGDTVFITNVGTYTVTLDVSITVSNLTMGGASGTQSLATAAQTITFNGTNTFATNTVFLLNGGTLNGDGVATFRGVFNWSAGTMDGFGQTVFTPTSTVNINSGNTRFLYRRTINLAGNATWTDGGSLAGGYGCVFNIQNGGLLDFQSAGDMYLNVSAPFTLNNSGTIRKSAGGINNFPGVVVNNTGSIDVQASILALAGGGTSSGNFNSASGAELRFSGGTHSLIGTPGFTGGGLYRIGVGVGELDFNTSLTLGTHWQLDVNGTLGGTNTVTFTGLFDWSGGTMDYFGQTVFTPTSTVNINSGNTRFLYRRTINLAGNATWTDGGSLAGGYGCVFNIQNGGLLDFQSAGDMYLNVSAPFTLNNSGTIRKSAGGINNFPGVVVNNTGSIDVQASILALAGGGTSSGNFNSASGAELRFSGGTHSLIGTPGFTGGGLYRIGVGVGELDFNTSLTLGTHWQLDVNGTLGGTNTVTFTGLFDWSGGTMDYFGQTVFTPTSTVNINSGNTRFLYRRTINLAGNATWTDGGSLAGGYGCVFNIQNGGVLDLRGPGSIYLNVTAPFLVNNHGIIRRSTAVGDFSISATVTNYASVQSRAGQLSFASSYVQRSGSTTLQGGNLGGNAVTLDIQGGTLSGAGTIAADVRNSSDVMPGGPFGFMSIANTISQIYSNTAIGRLSLELGGLVPGTNHDQLRVSGQANLSGTVHVDFVNGFVPTPGNSFTVMTYTARSGQFTDIQSPTGIVLSAVYFPTHLVLNAVTVTQVPPYIITHPTNVILKEGLTASFHVVAGGTPPLSYQWQRNSVDITGATNDTLTIPNVAVSNAATYRVIVSNFGGVTNSQGALLIVQPGFQTVEVDSGITNVLIGAAFFNGRDGVIVGSNGLMRVTSDGGASWITVSTGLTNITDVQYVGGAIFVAGNGGHTICVSYDGGFTWTPSYSGAQQINRMRFLSSNNGIAVGDNGAVLVWDGVSWTPINSGIDVRLFSVDYCGGYPVAVGEAGRIYRFDGTNWVLRYTEVNLATFNDVKFCGNGSVGLAVGTGGVIYQTTDCGLNWAPYQNPAVGVDLQSIAFGDCNTWWVAGDDGTLLQSTDGGLTWGTLYTGTTNRITSVVFIDGYGYYVDDGGRVHRFTYAPIPPNLPPLVALTKPSSTFTNSACVPLLFRATASDSNGFVAKVEFFANGVLIGTDTTTPYSYSWTNELTGNYTITARATDNQGATAVSSAITVKYVLPPVLHSLIPVGFVGTNTAFLVCMAGQAGSNYLIYAHTNVAAPFVNWQPLGFMTPTNGIWHYHDHDATNHSYRFYRARQVP